MRSSRVALRAGALVVLLVACARSDDAPSPASAVDTIEPAAAPSASAPAAPAAPAAVAGPVLVELYTSQGCSSCPPADALLSEIGEGAFGDDVVALAYHVDYWNYIGWRDPFSKKSWSHRQRAAASSLSGRVYTPMLVVNGRIDVVGSNRPKTEAAIMAARRAGQTVRVALERTKTGEGALHAVVSATPPPGVELFVAVTESGLRTRVSRGENSGRELVNNHIVRALVPVEIGANNAASVKIPLEADWDHKALKLVAFARDAKTLEVRGAAIE